MFYLSLDSWHLFLGLVFNNVSEWIKRSTLFQNRRESIWRIAQDARDIQSILKWQETRVERKQNDKKQKEDTKKEQSQCYRLGCLCREVRLNWRKNLHPVTLEEMLVWLYIYPFITSRTLWYMEKNWDTDSQSRKASAGEVTWLLFCKWCSANKSLNENSGKITDEVKVSDTIPDPPIQGEKIQKPVPRIRDKNLEGVSTSYHRDKTELGSSKNIWLYPLVRTTKGCVANPRNWGTTKIFLEQNWPWNRRGSITRKISRNGEEGWQAGCQHLSN